MSNILKFPTRRETTWESIRQLVEERHTKWRLRSPQPANFIQQPNSYEDAIAMKIKLHQWRAEGCQDSGDWESAALEIKFADGLQAALNEYFQWGLV